MGCNKEADRGQALTGLNKQRGPDGEISEVRYKGYSLFRTHGF